MIVRFQTKLLHTGKNIFSILQTTQAAKKRNSHIQKKKEQQRSWSMEIKLCKTRVEEIKSAKWPCFIILWIAKLVKKNAERYKTKKSHCIKERTSFFNLKQAILTF